MSQTLVANHPLAGFCLAGALHGQLFQQQPLCLG